VLLQLAKKAAAQWGGVNEFLEKSASKIDALTVVDDPRSAPTLYLFNDGQTIEDGISIGVSAFKIEHLDKLLKLKLRSDNDDEL
jgi:hypothetical protein